MNHRTHEGRLGKPAVFRMVAFAGAAALVAAPAAAGHSNGYHWTRTTTQIAPPVGDNVAAAWDGHLQTAVADWNQSTVIQSPLVAGSTTAKLCKPAAGTIQVCSAAYGRTGWLSLGSIWLSGGHVSQATIKLNDTYFGTAPYNTPSWRQSVLCRELGHVYGLDHQDEDFGTDTTGSCMDNTSNPAGNEHPDQHDYDQLLLIYNHIDSAAAAPSLAALGDAPADWGVPVRRNARGQPDMFVRDLGNGHRAITHVVWAAQR